MKYRILFKEHDPDRRYIGDVYVGEADKLIDARKIAKRHARLYGNMLHQYHVSSNQRLFPHAGEAV